MVHNKIHDNVLLIELTLVGMVQQCQERVDIVEGVKKLSNKNLCSKKVLFEKTTCINCIPLSTYLHLGQNSYCLL